VKFQLATLAAAALFVLAALFAGEHQVPAVTGAAMAGATAVLSVFAMGRAVRAAARPTQRAIAVVAVLFLVRLVLVAVGTVVLVRAGRSAVAFVIAFFVPYFAFSALEGAYLHSLRRMGTPA
jgi:hypothetical protein